MSKSNKVRSRLCYVIGTLCLGMGSSYALKCDYTPYIGLSGQVSHLKFNDRFGGPLYNTDLPSIGVFAGVKLNDYFGIEAGFDASQRKKRDRLLSEGQFPPGAVIPVPSGQSQIYKTTVSMNSLNLGLVGFAPLGVICNNTSLFGAVGLSLIRFKANQTLLLLNQTTPTADESAILSFGFKSTNKKVVPYLTAGIDQPITKCTGFRLFANWKNTALLNEIKSREAPISRRGLKFKDTLSYGVSLYYSF